MNYDLTKLFFPKSVAVVGASNTPGKVGFAIIKNLIEADFVGEIFPVNLKESEVQGIKAYPKISDIKRPVDLVVVCVPAPFVLSVMQECVAKSIKNAVVITAGFSETGEEGKKIELELKKIIEENNMNVVGPNTLGIINTETGLNVSFASTFPMQGSIAVVSQSGALCTAILDWARQEKIGFSKFISTGNKSFLDEAAYFNFLEHDSRTKAVFVYMESVKNSHKFLKEAQQLAKKKPVILIKSGRSEAGAKAASSHTGAISGDDKLFTVACKKANILRMNSIEGFFDMAKLLSKVKKIKGFNLAVVTNAGGPGVIVADSASAHSFNLPLFSKETFDEVSIINPHPSNPLDLIGDAKPIDYKKALRVLQSDKQIDLIYCLLTPQSMTDPERVADVVVELHRKKPILCSFLGGTSVANPRRYLKEHGVVEFETPERGIKALSRLQEYYLRRKVKKIFDQKISSDKNIKKILKGKKQLNLEESFEILKSIGVNTPTSIFFSNLSEISTQMEKITFPVALKTATGLAHKTDYGLVKANIISSQELLSESERMFAKQKEMSIPQRLVVQEMIKGQEVLVSAITGEFGKVITYGLGGIFVEVMKDVSQKIAPINESDLEEMLLEVKGTAVLKGLRTKKVYDIEALKKLIKSLSTLVLTYPEIEEIEFNPIIVTESGCYAVDAVITLKK